MEYVYKLGFEDCQESKRDKKKAEIEKYIDFTKNIKEYLATPQQNN